jgi:hypothetical protein
MMSMMKKLIVKIRAPRKVPTRIELTIWPGVIAVWAVVVAGVIGVDRDRKYGWLCVDGGDLIVGTRLAQNSIREFELLIKAVAL